MIPWQARNPGRGRIYDSITETIGDTPLVRLARLPKEAGVKADILLKLEFFNPLSSVKDRIGVSHDRGAGSSRARSRRANPRWSSRPAAIPASRSPSSPPPRAISLILVMPESMSIERRKMLALLGAELVLTEAAKGMKGAIAKAQEIVAATPGAVMPQQFENPANPGNPPQHDGGGNLERHRGQGRCRHLRRRHRRHDHRRRPGAEGEEAVGEDDRAGAGRFAGALRRPARPAQDPGHRRGLRARPSSTAR